MLDDTVHAGQPRHGTDTRRAILSLLLTHRSQSAPQIAEELSLSAAAVRKQLHGLHSDGLITSGESVGDGRRGRPATYWSLTASGRGMFGHTYDQLALEALEALKIAGGEQAVDGFADSRAEAMLAGVHPATSSEPDSVMETVDELARAFTSRGYATSVQHAGDGVQICRHHCPIARVALKFPELCAAETRAISRIVGVPVQSLATISSGHGICTTNVALYPASPHQRPG